MAVPERHFVNGARLTAPFPDGLQKALFGMGCFWGAEKKFWQLPGVYTVETQEVSLDFTSFHAYRRVSMVMHCHDSNGIRRYMRVDPSALAAALARDVRTAK